MKKHTSKTIGSRAKLILIVAASILILLQILCDVVLMARVQWLETDTNKNENTLTVGVYESTVTRFCYDHAIQPCDDSHIATWNSTHPTDHITPTAELFPANNLFNSESVRARS